MIVRDRQFGGGESRLYVQKETFCLKYTNLLHLKWPLLIRLVPGFEDAVIEDFS